jgi:hypothetical protein
MAMKKTPSTAATAAASDSDNRRVPARELITKALLDEKLAVRPHRQSMLWDTKEPGLSVLISRGPKEARRATLSFRVVYYLKSNPGKPRYFHLGRYPDDFPGFNKETLQKIRDDARQVRTDARAGNDPKRPRPTGKFAETVADFIEDHAKQNRTWPETKRIFDRYVTPEWADKNIEDIAKGDVSDLLSNIARKKIDIDGEKRGSPAVARATRTQLVTLFNWWEAKYSTKDFRNPIPRLLKSDPLKAAGARERHLEDNELRAFWTACGEMGAYGAAVKLGLLTAQRFRKVGSMRRADVKSHLRIQGEDIGNVWDATRDNDPKNKRVSVVPLSALARSILAGVPFIDVDDGEDFVFTTTGRGPLKGWSKYKARLDRKMLALLQRDDPNLTKLKPWQHRDLRRTARTLLARAQVSREVSEHCLGHVLPIIERTYNRYSYLPEKREAFDKLADLIGRIVSPPANVVPLAPRAGKRKAGKGARSA